MSCTHGGEGRVEGGPHGGFVTFLGKHKDDSGLYPEETTWRLSELVQGTPSLSKIENEENYPQAA